MTTRDMRRLSSMVYGYMSKKYVPAVLAEIVTDYAVDNRVWAAFQAMMRTQRVIELYPSMTVSLSLTVEPMRGICCGPDWIGVCVSWRYTDHDMWVSFDTLWDFVVTEEWPELGDAVTKDERTQTCFHLRRMINERFGVMPVGPSTWNEAIAEWASRPDAIATMHKHLDP